MLIQSGKETVSRTVEFGKDGHAAASFTLAAKPTSARVVVGPANASDVVESKEHFEATGGLTGWNATRFWLVNEFLVVPLDTSKFTDGTHLFRVVGWQKPGAVLINPKVLPLCGTDGKTDDVFVLTFDNQALDTLTHPVSHNCGLGVHICTQEPDNFISSVKINGVEVGPCGNAGAAIGMAEIDFQATDVDGHLAFYTLYSTWGVSLARNLLDPQYGGVVTPIVAGTPTGWSAVPNPNSGNAGYYGVALAQGAVAPNWSGGQYRLTIPAANAFPEPCCYQLQLYTYKRTIVGYQSGIVFACEHGYAQYNLTRPAPLCQWTSGTSSRCKRCLISAGCTHRDLR